MAKHDLPSTRVSRTDLSLLKRLTEVMAVSGDEGAVRQIIRQEIEPYADKVEVDTLGNLLAWRTGRGRSRPRVMVAAHMDEVGLMVVGADGEGLLRFETVGNLIRSHLAGKPVWIGEDRLPGVIAMPPIHLTSGEDKRREIDPDVLRIDIGTETKDAALQLVRAGMWATFATAFASLGPTVRAKALDDRLGVASLIELLRHPPDNIDLLAAFTVQEELGARGARAAAYRLEPDAAIALDATPARDLPTWDGEENTAYNTRLGAGPAIYVADLQTISDPRLVQLFFGAAEEEGIRYQIRQPGSGGTDIATIHTARGGIPSISVSVPARYVHTPTSIASLADWRASVRLVWAALSRLQRNHVR